MATEKQEKTVVTATTPSPVDSKAGRMRRLADAIAAVYKNPCAVRMSSLWTIVRSEDFKEDNIQLSPDDAQKYAAEEEKLARAYARQKEFKAAFKAGRLDLKENEAVFLEETIDYLPSVWVDAWSAMEEISDKRISGMQKIAQRLRFRADAAQSGTGAGEATPPADPADPRKRDLCTIVEHPSGRGRVVYVGGTSYHITRPKCLEFIEQAKSGEAVKWPRVRSLFLHHRRRIEGTSTEQDGHTKAVERIVLNDHERFASTHIESVGQERFRIVAFRPERKR